MGNSTYAMIIISILPVIIAITFIAIGIWVYKDAKKRGLNARLWAFIVIVINPYFIGLILYMLVGRKEEKKGTCIECGEKVSIYDKFCRNCGAMLDGIRMKSSDSVKQKKDMNKVIKIIIISIVAVVATVIIFLVFLMPVAMNGFDNTSITVEEIGNSNFVDEYNITGDNTWDSGYSFLKVENSGKNFWRLKAKRSKTENYKTFEYEDGKEFDVSYEQKEGDAILSIEQDGVELHTEHLTQGNTGTMQRNILIYDLEGIKDGDITLKLKVDAKDIKFELRMKDKSY